MWRWADGLVFDIAGFPAVNRWQRQSGAVAATWRVQGLAVFRIDRFRPSPAAAEALRARLAPFLRARGARAVNPRLIKAAEIALVIAIGAVLATIFWSAFGPITRPSTTPRASAAPVEAAPSGPIDPFRMSSVEAAAPAGELEIGPDLAETTLNLVLHGTWVTEEGGAAFIKTPDEKQGRYSIGDTITNGVTLEKVYRDQVVINRGGARESLRLINREQVVQAKRASAAPQDNKIASDIDGLAAIGHFVVAQPELDEIGNVRLVLQPAGDTKRFEAMGLRSGDTLVAVDNQPIGGDIAGALDMLSNIEGKQSVSISIERDGVVMPIVVALSSPAGAANE